MSVAGRASVLRHPSDATFGDGPQTENHQFVPTRYCMCLNCGQELMADSYNTTVVDCFACRTEQTSTSTGAGQEQPPQANKSSENIFLGTLRKSRQHTQQSVPRSPRPGFPSGSGRDSTMLSQGQPRASLRSSGTLLQPQSKDRADPDGATDGTSSRPSAQVSKLLAREAQKYDPQAAAANSSWHKLEQRRKRLSEIHCCKEGVGKPSQSQSAACLPRISQPLNLAGLTLSREQAPMLPKPSSSIPTGNHTLDSVLGKLSSKPKLLGALDRMVNQVRGDKNTLRAAFKEFDANKDGILGKSQTASGLRKLGVTLQPSELDAVLRAFDDVDGNGSVEVDMLIEFIISYQSHLKLDQSADKERVEALAQKRKSMREGLQNARSALALGARSGGVQ